MRSPHENGNGASPQNPEVLALRALAWVVSDGDRAHRLLALTGLDAEQLRHGAEDPLVLGATLDFLAGHEPDLLACATALEIPPGQLVAAAQELAR